MSNGNTTKKGKVVEVGDNSDAAEDGFTERVLMSMVFDITQLAEGIERIKVQVFTLAKAHGIVPVKE